MGAFLTILAIIVFLIILSRIREKVDRNVSREKSEELALIEYELKKQEIGKKRLRTRDKVIELEEQYGRVTQKIAIVPYAEDINRLIYVFEQSSTVLICGTPYKFSDVLGSELSCNDVATQSNRTVETKTSGGSMVGRAVVGGLLLGGVGAIIGGATAKKKSIETIPIPTQKKYSVRILVNSLSSSSIDIGFGNNAEIANKVSDLMNVIINRNNINHNL